MARRKKHKHKKKNYRNKTVLFSSRNYTFMGIGILLVAIGFTAMYLENEVEGFISLFISPILIMAGYMVIIYAIMTDKNGSGETQNAETTS